uniref:uncharacterized protein LOC127069666 isoform X2 n=1 Tax=Vespula vulgaris TaxID=7454 RepID=UPI00223C041A|nr:uncharacterized protein LOC127069666 isoform X2 [Vespula vulgaris]
MTNIKYLSIAVLLSAFIVDIIIANPFIQGNINNIINSIDQDCNCIRYNCGCCKHIEYDIVFLNGTFCGNASYLEKDYGFSVTMSYNNFSLINETISARNPPPVCYNFLEFSHLLSLPKLSHLIYICLRLYDIDINKNGFHLCFEIKMKVLAHDIIVIPLGCINKFKHANKIYKAYPNVIMI